MTHKFAVVVNKTFYDKVQYNNDFYLRVLVLDVIRALSDEPFMSGVRSRMMFENGYGVSVVSHTYSYGGKDGLFEVAVLDKDGDLTYNTPVTNDVVGYLNPDEVTEIMEEVQKL